MKHIENQEQLIHDLIFADIAPLVAQTERALQCLTSSFTYVAQLFRLDFT